ncbi:F-box protein [Cardamine amara subsp. amara]|uniref:F-box protein n=1 Tax=Cardamine amara subsp. amara TaxID=228776 RepID=A0ABD1BIM3_CARAN
MTNPEIPIDLLMDIFSSVPAKSIARFRCLSKFWESILCHPDFTELYLTMSPTRPPLLSFTFENDGKLLFFSTPYPQNPDENTCLVPTRYHVHHYDYPTYEVTSALRGFICYRDRTSQDTMVICNPVTGESVSLPKVELKSINTETKTYLGYDPIDKQMKVLCIKFDDFPNPCDEHQVLTLENGKHLWRRIQCKPHYPKSDGICIDGTLYYTAGFDRGTSVSMIVCFDVRSEKFSFINIDEGMLINAYCTLINYKGKLGALQFSFLSPKHLEFWVLQDAENFIWSKDIYNLRPFWNKIVKRTELFIVGMTAGGEVVLTPYYLVDTFCIYYFNLECKSLTRVQIQGLEKFNCTRVYTSLDYAENLKLM